MEADDKSTPCVPAVTTFSSGAVCESASTVVASEVKMRELPNWVSMPGGFERKQNTVDPQAQSAALCAELGGQSASPYVVPFGEEASIGQNQWMSWKQAEDIEGYDVLVAQVRAGTIESRAHPRLPPNSTIEWPKNLQVRMRSEIELTLARKESRPKP